MEIRLNGKPGQLGRERKAFDLFSFLVIVVVTFLLYHWSNPKPLDWYKHFVYLARTFLTGRVDIWGFPEFYQDLVRVNGKVYMPFPPIPAVLLMPSVMIAGTAASQVLVSKIVGAVNVGLMWLVLGKIKARTKLRWLLTLFWGFGTAHWYAAQMGTTWFYAHVVAVMFVLLALGAFFNDKPAWLIGLLGGGAALSRHPMLGAAGFFLIMFWQRRQWRKLVWFGVGLGLMAAVQLSYNLIRFGNVFEEGYVAVAQQYRQSSYAYTILLKYFPNTPRFAYLDIRNIPLHLYTMLVMPPEVSLKPFKVQPSPYGMSLLFTSPLLLWLLGKPVRKRRLFWASFVAASLTSVPILLHFTQGWVQFGYRFSLDLMPFLIIMLALRMKRVNWVSGAALAWSVGVNAWGIWWAQRLGW